jgi:23S rRNA pseudouridine2605 synthase
MEERLQKILAKAGFGSRRACEELITAARVTVNGSVAILGSKADPEKDQISLDGKPIKNPEPLVYIALNKPRGVISAVTSPDPRSTVRDLVPFPGRIYPVGRLDADSEGLVLLTNDGTLANHLTHPRYEHEKEYRVLVNGHPDQGQLAAWQHGVVLADKHRTAPADVWVDEISGKKVWLGVILREGRKHQIHEMGDNTGLYVERIIRIRIGSLKLGGLKPAQWRQLTIREVEDLKKLGIRGKNLKTPGRRR